MSFINRVSNHKLSLALLGALLVIVGVVSAWNMVGYPARFEDEGTYVAQAWAMEYRHELTHYTYWYDHPPVGWAQLAGWTTLTHGFERYASAITAGREFMLVMHLVSAALIFTLARRMGYHRVWAAAAVLLFGLSPLSVEFSRYVLLDNIALPWMLAAFVLALSPKKSLSSVAGSAFCMAIAVLSKETFLVLLPVLLYALWRNSDVRNRRFAFVLFISLFGFLCSFYVLFAALKNELFEGAHHVSLIGAIKWQLFGRVASGSVLDPQSGARGLVGFWFGIDPWPLTISTVLLPITLFIRKARLPAIALLIQLLLMLRSGYLPYPYIIAMLPFAALVIAGVCNATLSRFDHKAIEENWRIQARAVSLVVAMVLFVQFIAPVWARHLTDAATKDADKPDRETVAWISKNVTRQDRVVIDSGLWVDLVRAVFVAPQAAWLYKTETDPEVASSIGGWQNIRYVAISAATLDPRNAHTFPMLFKAKEHSVVAASFGEGSGKIVILKVDPQRPATALSSL